MTSFAPISTEPGFWQAEILDILLPRSPYAAPRPLSQDAELLRQLSFIPGLKEILMTRQVHALEHATVWVLTNMAGRASSPTAINTESLGGLSTDRGFYLYGEASTPDIHRAAQIALRRITTGEWNLAVHPRCGTNLSVGMLLTAGLTIGASTVLPKDPISQIMAIGMAAIAATQLTPELGALAQQYVTTAIPFNLAISTINLTRDEMGQPSHFVEVQWVE
jgi:hypothetical protein